MIAYHVTTIENYERIKEEGIIPTIGPRSLDLGEETPKIYLFPNKETCADALTNWLGEQFDEEDELVILKVNIGQYKQESEVGFEITVNEVIPPFRILKAFNEVDFEAYLEEDKIVPNKPKTKPF